MMRNTRHETRNTEKVQPGCMGNTIPAEVAKRASQACNVERHLILFSHVYRKKMQVQEDTAEAQW